ncbi:MAG TPA: DUF58 domain-containing protein [Candidatus Dormibacteraeota bacterium]|nr:DUF58 domain-containing protein [Candidatus Dormibacteraeota bacterium]
MTARAFLGIGLVLVGSVLGSPLVVLLGLAAAVFEAVRLVWRGRGLRAVTYERRLARDRAVVGDVVPLDITVWNRKRLPLAWLHAEDAMTTGISVAERELTRTEEGQALENAWSLAPFERVVRHFHLRADRRGVHGAGPVRLSVGDIFAGAAGREERTGTARLVVRPRSVPVASLAPTARWGGSERARRGLLEHPALYAGVRDYQPGDPLRHLHHRASARLGRPVTKRFEPARERDLLIALDIQTLEGPTWQPAYDDDLVESLCVAAASLARHLREEGAAVGLAVAGYSGGPRPVAVLAPSEAAEQVPRILDVLARLSPFPSAPFETLVAALPRSLRQGAEVVVLSARAPGPYLAALRRMRRLGFGVTLLAIGPRAPGAVAAARAAGLAARTIRLDGTWADATGLVVA